MKKRAHRFLSLELSLLFIDWILLFAVHLDFNKFIVRDARFKECTGNCKDRICQANQSDFIINVLAVMRVTTTIAQYFYRFRNLENRVKFSHLMNFFKYFLFLRKKYNLQSAETQLFSCRLIMRRN